MNWKAEAIKDLKNYPQRKNAIDSINEKIKVLDEQMISLKGISTSEPVMGGMSKQEERWLDNISEREKLGFNLKIVETLVEIVEKGLGALDEQECAILRSFYIERRERRIEELCEEFHFEKSRLYQLKDNALRKFTIAMYGTVEI